MKTISKISIIFFILIAVQAQAQATEGTEKTGSVTEDAYMDPNELQELQETPNPSGQKEELSYWEKEFQDNAQKFYHHFEIFFADFVIPVYHMMKESALLTTAVLLAVLLYFTKMVSGIFKGDGTKKFKYNKEEPISYSDLNQHFKNFSKELSELKQQVKKGPEGQSSDPQVAANHMNVPELDKLTKSLTKTEDHLTKLYQENKQLNQFLATFQREILESHKEIWKELHSLKTTRPAASSSRAGERRGQSVSAEDRIPKRVQDPSLRSTQAESTLKARETGPVGSTNISNGTGATEIKQQHLASQDSTVTKSQEIPLRSSQTIESHLPTESNNPFSSPVVKNEQKLPATQTNPISKQPGGFQRPVPQGRPPFGGPSKQPPLGGATSDPQQKLSQPENKEEPAQQANLPETNSTEQTEKTANNSTKNEVESTPTEEEKSTTTEQTNPETETTQMPGLGAGPFKGIPPKKPTPVVRNNFAVPQKRVNQVPTNVVKKLPPMMNPGANFVSNPEGGSGPNI